MKKQNGNSRLFICPGRYIPYWYIMVTFMVIIFPLLIILVFTGCSPQQTIPTSTQSPNTPQVSNSISSSPSSIASQAASKPSMPVIIMASTTSTRDSGLMDVLLPLFSQRTGYIVKPIYVGSGQAMTMGERGEADVLLVHAPAAEINFMKNGHGVDRRLVMHNDFILVGPPSDPAGVRGLTSIIEALQKIADRKINFYSRGDNSGTDQIEKFLWGKIGIPVKDGSASNPPWYLEANLGMGDLLRVVSEKQGYTITDRASYLNNLKTLSLEIMVQGDRSLLNVYHVIVINPAKSSRINYEGAKAFADFMVGSEVQSIIAKFGVDKYGQSLFFPDAGKTDAELGLPIE